MAAHNDPRVLEAHWDAWKYVDPLCGSCLGRLSHLRCTEAEEMSDDVFMKIAMTLILSSVAIVCIRIVISAWWR